MPFHVVLKENWALNWTGSCSGDGDPDPWGDWDHKSTLLLLCPWARHLTQGCFEETVLAISMVWMKCIFEMAKTLINTDYSWMNVSYRNNNISSADPLSWATTKSTMWFSEAMKSSMNFRAGDANLCTSPAKTCLLQSDITKQSHKVLCQMQGQLQPVLVCVRLHRSDVYEDNCIFP